MNRKKTRGSLLGLAAGYLLYTAYELFRDRGDPDTTMPPAVRIIFIVLFVVAAVPLLVYAVRTWKDGTRDEEQERRRDDESRLK